ncbi:hypothetical protein E2C01_067335 [Portunus trituberculatus]|uniref:Uncharacterized protein n=1 Tax=Portunus trituberculatus TaxID=210409 RepID=A0A5B7HTC2_PORTR|nr:hypothetical protein [Portunus trituberculatus]
MHGKTMAQVEAAAASSLVPPSLTCPTLLSVWAQRWKCKSAQRCRYCAGNHQSSRCLEKIHAGTTVLPLCCNCRDDNNVNSRVYPVTSSDSLVSHRPPVLLPILLKWCPILPFLHGTVPEQMIPYHGLTCRPCLCQPPRRQHSHPCPAQLSLLNLICSMLHLPHLLLFLFHSLPLCHLQLLHSPLLVDRSHWLAALFGTPTLQANQNATLQRMLKLLTEVSVNVSDSSERVTALQQKQYTATIPERPGLPVHVNQSHPIPGDQPCEPSGLAGWVTVLLPCCSPGYWNLHHGHGTLQQMASPAEQVARLYHRLPPA